MKKKKRDICIKNQISDNFVLMRRLVTFWNVSSLVWVSAGRSLWASAGPGDVLHLPDHPLSSPLFSQVVNGSCAYFTSHTRSVLADVKDSGTVAPPCGRRGWRKMSLYNEKIHNLLYFAFQFLTIFKISVCCRWIETFRGCTDTILLTAEG